MSNMTPPPQVLLEGQDQSAAPIDISLDEPSTPVTSPIAEPSKSVVPPSSGQAIESAATGNTYTTGEWIGEGYFGLVFGCVDGWGNQLAAKVLKPLRTYEEIKASAQAELQKLFAVRHPYVTYVFDAFEYRDTFYIITERAIAHSPTSWHKARKFFTLRFG